MENFWPACLSRFENELSAQQFNTWIKPLQAAIDGDTVRIFAPNRFVMQWVKDRFLKKIEQFAAELNLSSMKIEFIVGELNSNNKNSTDKTQHSNEKIKPSTQHYVDDDLKNSLELNLKTSLMKN